MCEFLQSCEPTQQYVVAQSANPECITNGQLSSLVIHGFQAINSKLDYIATIAKSNSIKLDLMERDLRERDRDARHRRKSPSPSRSSRRRMPLPVKQQTHDAALEGFNYNYVSNYFITTRLMSSKTTSVEYEKVRSVFHAHVNMAVKHVEYIDMRKLECCLRNRIGYAGFVWALDGEKSIIRGCELHGCPKLL